MQPRRWPSPAAFSLCGRRLQAVVSLFPSSGFVVHPRANTTASATTAQHAGAQVAPSPWPEPTRDLRPRLFSGSAENTTTEKSHCHLQGGCKSAAARSFPRCTHFPHTLTFSLPQISSPIKKRISNTFVQKNLESGEHEDSAPRNAISKTKLPVCLCMGRTEEAGEVKGGKKKKNHRKQNLGDSFAPVSGLESLTFHAQQRPHGANCTRPTPCKHSLRQRRVQKDCLQQFFSCYRGRRYRFRFPSAQARLPGPNSLESS